MHQREASSRPRLVRLLALLSLLAFCGCADVRVARETPNGGAVDLPMNTNCWPMYYRNRAEKLMSEKCPGGYKIDREEYVFNGREGPEGRRYHDSYFGYTDPDDENAPYLRKEYRITFHAAAPANGPPAAKPPPPAPPSGSAVPAPLPPGVEGKEELPPPRPLKSGQEYLPGKPM